MLVTTRGDCNSIQVVDMIAARAKSSTVAVFLPKTLFQILAGDRLVSGYNRPIVTSQGVTLLMGHFALWQCHCCCWARQLQHPYRGGCKYQCTDCKTCNSRHTANSLHKAVEQTGKQLCTSTKPAQGACIALHHQRQPTLRDRISGYFLCTSCILHWSKL
jgi:hypothetical protein